MIIGILDLQGDIYSHMQALQDCKVSVKRIRTLHDLETCQGIILPGGESTSMEYLIKKSKLDKPLLNFMQKKPVFATCAGLILLSKHILFSSQATGLFPILDISIERNGYGRQKNSIKTELPCTFLNKPKQKIPAFFIRAPIIRNIHSKNINILSTYHNKPTLIQQDFILAATFHTELSKSRTLHRYFINIIEKYQSNNYVQLPEP